MEEIKICPNCKLEVAQETCYIDDHGLEHCPYCGHVELEDKE